MYDAPASFILGHTPHARARTHAHTHMHTRTHTRTRTHPRACSRTGPHTNMHASMRTTQDGMRFLHASRVVASLMPIALHEVAYLMGPPSNVSANPLAIHILPGPQYHLSCQSFLRELQLIIRSCTARLLHPASKGPGGFLPKTSAQLHGR